MDLDKLIQIAEKATAEEELKAKKEGRAFDKAKQLKPIDRVVLFLQ